MKFKSLYGLSSDTTAELVIARRGLRLSERLPKTMVALVAPVDSTKHVWSYWAVAGRKVKGSTRHSFFNPNSRVANSQLEVTLSGFWPGGKPNSASIP